MFRSFAAMSYAAIQRDVDRHRLPQSPLGGIDWCSCRQSITAHRFAMRIERSSTTSSKCPSLSGEYTIPIAMLCDAEALPTFRNFPTLDPFGSGELVLSQSCSQDSIREGHSYGIAIAIPTFPIVRQSWNFLHRRLDLYNSVVLDYRSPNQSPSLEVLREPPFQGCQSVGLPTY